MPKPRRIDPDVAKLMNELRDWCAQEHGRQAILAKALGVTRQHVHAWIAGEITPNLGNGLRLKAFLQAQTHTHPKPSRRPPKRLLAKAA